jgi:hypothetical protein
MLVLQWFAPCGRLAQLVRAPALQAGGRRFEPCTAHHLLLLYHLFTDGFFFFLSGNRLTVIKM